MDEFEAFFGVDKNDSKTSSVKGSNPVKPDEVSSDAEKSKPRAEMVVKPTVRVLAKTEAKPLARTTTQANIVAVSEAEEILILPPDSEIHDPEMREFERDFVPKNKLLQRDRQLSRESLDENATAHYEHEYYWNRSESRLHYEYDRSPDEICQSDNDKHYVYVYSDYKPINESTNSPRRRLKHDRNAQMADIFRYEIKNNEKWWTLGEFYKEILVTAQKRMHQTFPINILTKANVFVSAECTSAEYRTRRENRRNTIFKMTARAMQKENCSWRPEPIKASTGLGSISELKLIWKIRYQEPILMDSLKWQPEVVLAKTIRDISEGPYNSMTRVGKLIQAHDEYIEAKHRMLDQETDFFQENYEFVNQPGWNASYPFLTNFTNRCELEQYYPSRKPDDEGFESEPLPDDREKLNKIFSEKALRFTDIPDVAERTLPVTGVTVRQQTPIRENVPPSKKQRRFRSKAKRNKRRMANRLMIEIDSENSRMNDDDNRTTVPMPVPNPYQKDDKTDTVPKRNFRKNGGLPKRPWKHDRR